MKLHNINLNNIILFTFVTFLISVNIACTPVKHIRPTVINSDETKTSTSRTHVPTITKTLVQSTPTSTATPLPTQSPTQTINQPAGCQIPPENYELIEINGMIINQRTYSMLLNAQQNYGGEIDLTGYHLTQGSYNNTVSASFGTHDGGGAVDLSVIQYGTYQVLFEDIDPLIQALRIAGFAAWLRDFDQLYPGSPIHIHAIAIGDRDLSQAAIDQLNGDFGYFKGYNGIPQPPGYQPIADEHGGPVICSWMIEAGYQDLR